MINDTSRRSVACDTDVMGHWTVTSTLLQIYR